MAKKAGLRVAETGGLRVAEKAGGKRKAPEPEAEKEKEPASEPEPFDPRPWQAKAISLINDPEADPNSIWWFNSPEEGTGKTDFENELLVNQYGALKIQFTSPRHTKALLGDFWNNTRQGKPLPPKTAEQQKQFDLWMQHKIICVDIARSDTATLNNSSTYVCMEDLQAGFMVSHYSPCTVIWKDANGCRTGAAVGRRTGAETGGAGKRALCYQESAGSSVRSKAGAAQALANGQCRARHHHTEAAAVWR